jgi:hypothetical protein
MTPRFRYFAGGYGADRRTDPAPSHIPWRLAARVIGHGRPTDAAPIYRADWTLDAMSRVKPTLSAWIDDKNIT